MPFDFITDEKQREQAVEAYNAKITELTDAHTLELDEQTSGLKSKNSELLDEKKQLQKKTKEYEDFDFDKAKEAMDFLENNKDAQLIKDGKVEELLQKKTSQLQSDHEAKIGELNSILEETSTKAIYYENAFKTKMIDDGLREAAVAAKIRPEAIPDVLLHGRSVFSLADDGSLESRDGEGKLRKTIDDKVLTTTNWIEGLKKSAPHYWPPTVGAGASGGQMDSSDLTQAMNDAAKRGDMKTYRKLRAKKSA